MNQAACGRPTWVEIDLSALGWNLHRVRRRVGSGIRILAVVKADAYGHGAECCAPALAAAGADQFGVATVEEGAALRRAGITAPVVVLGLARPDEAPALLAMNLETAVADLETALHFARAARRRRRRLGLHLKVDTGMGRIGADPGEAAPLARRLRNAAGVDLRGVFSHFAHADGREPRLLGDQMRLFASAAEGVRAYWPRALRHLANSAAVIEAPRTYFDMVRPGLMLYGLYPASRLRRREDLKPVLSWKTAVVQVKRVSAGTGISYGHAYVTKRPTWVATLPVGYADGFPRNLTNRGVVLIKGRRCPVIGRVTMDMTMVDVTSAAPVRLGETAVMVGRQRGRELTADDMARLRDTISYEVVTAIGDRVPRRPRGGRRG